MAFTVTNKHVVIMHEIINSGIHFLWNNSDKLTVFVCVAPLWMLFFFYYRNIAANFF